jgi:signal transduction histidine kinase
MRSPTLNSRRDRITRVATRTSMRHISGRRDTLAQRAERTLAESNLVQTAHRAAEVAVHDECLRLARELHDCVAQTLYGVTLSASRVLTLLERSQTEQLSTIVNEVLRLANDSQAELRALLHDLRSDESCPLQGGLTEALAIQATGPEAGGRCQVRLSLAE